MIMKGGFLSFPFQVTRTPSVPLSAFSSYITHTPLYSHTTSQASY